MQASTNEIPLSKTVMGVVKSFDSWDQAIAADHLSLESFLDWVILMNGDKLWILRWMFHKHDLRILQNAEQT